MSRRRQRPRPAAEPGPLRDLRAIVAAGGTPLLAAEPVAAAVGPLVVRVQLDTSAIKTVPGGLPMHADHEDVLIWFTPGYPQVPPWPFVDHDRFVGQAHVLQGDRLCVYLDPDQEWHSRHGVAGFLNRLYDWFEDAAAGRFDPRTALYHPVGGVLHADPGTPTVVVREEPASPFGPYGRRWLHARSDSRLDLTARQHAAGGVQVAVVTVGAPLRYGAGSTLKTLTGALFRAEHGRAGGTLAFFAETAALNPPGEPLYFVLAVRAGGTGGAAPAHLICGRLPATAAAPLAAATTRPGARLGQVTVGDVPFDAQIEWCTVSEERPKATVRRDRDRPVAAYVSKHIIIWGCGGLGSWIAEFIGRAGAARLTLCDPARVSGGLLVRQDYTEEDVGVTKANALARRLRELRDGLHVDVVEGRAATDARGNLPACDLLVDATVSNAVAALLTEAWPRTANKPVVARIATDRSTSSLGLLTVTAPGHGPAPEDVDRRTGEAVVASGLLEPYRALWDEPDRGDELTPEPGCSTPTFHGSAADLAAVAGTLASLLAPHLHAPALHGSHLVGLPHAPAPGHHWVGGTVFAA